MHSGIFAFTQIARFNKIAIDPKQLIHEYGDADGNLSQTNFLRAIKSNSFKAKPVKLSVDNLDTRTLPIIVKDKDGEYFVLAGINQDRYLVVVQGQEDV